MGDSVEERAAIILFDLFHYYSCPRTFKLRINFLRCVILLENRKSFLNFQNFQTAVGRGEYHEILWKGQSNYQQRDTTKK